MAVPVPIPLTVEQARGEITIGILADTHIPDRVNQIHPEVGTILRAAGVSRILHAGDISARWVLGELEQVAPVTAVRGNRDFLAGRLRQVEFLDLGGVSLALMHGHGGIFHYLRDKLDFYREGYRLERYLDLLVSAAGRASVVVFGHTHHAVIHQHRGKLIFNPGSASFGPHPGDLPTLGLLHISAAGDVRPEIITLCGWGICDRKWVNN